MNHQAGIRAEYKRMYTLQVGVRDLMARGTYSIITNNEQFRT